MSDAAGPSRLGRRALLAGGGAGCLLAAATPFVRPVRRNTDDRVVKLKAVDPRAVSAIPTDSPQVALTFDDGPDPAFTPRVLKILADHRVHATFFVIGRNALKYPDLIAATLEGGHTVANHTQDHLWLNTLDQPTVAEQLSRCTSTFDRLDVPTNELFRPPRGLTSPAVAAATVALGKRSFFWGTCLEANLSHHANDIAASLTAGHATPGTIILAHDGGHLDGPNPQSIDRTRTVQALPALIDLTRARGLDFATLPALQAARRTEAARG